MYLGNQTSEDSVMVVSTARGPHEVLGVPASAAPAEVRQAYRALAKRFHPDRWATADPQTRSEAELRMKEVNGAYRALMERSGPVAAPPRAAPAAPAPPPAPVWRRPAAGPWVGPFRTCSRCGEAYPVAEPWCRWCYWPNRTRRQERRYGTDGRIGLVAVLAVTCTWLWWPWIGPVVTEVLPQIIAILALGVLLFVGSRLLTWGPSTRRSRGSRGGQPGSGEL